MLVVLIIFVVSYTGSTIFEIVIVAREQQDKFFSAYANAIIAVTRPFMTNVLPIFCVYLLHFRNYGKNIETIAED
jgi:hypothetical protein